MTVSTLRQAAFVRLGRRFFYGWVILLVAGVGIFASGPGQSHTFSVFIGPISRDLGLSNTVIALAYGLATVVASFGLPLVGRVVDRRGPRLTTLLVATLLGFACIGFAMVGGLVTLALGFLGLRFLGQGSLMLNCANLVAQWFSRRRGLAMSLMALGFSASMAVHPPLAQWLTAELGWREAWLVMAVMTWALLLPLVAVLVHDRPEEIGLRPDGDAALREGETPPPLTGLTLPQALRTATFYIVAAGLFSISMLVTALHFYQVQILVSQGLPPDVPARVFAISAVTMVLAMPLVGRALDRLPTNFVFAGGLLVLAAALAAVGFVANVATAIAYAVVFGVTNAMSMTLFAFLWARYFGRRHLGSIQGVGQMVSVIGASLGPLPFGIAFDMIGSYREALLLSALLPLAAALVAALFLRPPQLTEA